MTAVVAKIREAECIGCMKCVYACPVDAIFGAPNFMHVVIANQCTGCRLCVLPCPMDCIDLIPVNQLKYDKNQACARAKAKIKRGDFRRAGHTIARTDSVHTAPVVSDKQKYIQNAVARAKNRRLSTPPFKTLSCEKS